MPAQETVRVERARHEDIPALCRLLAALFAIEADFSADAGRQHRGLELLLAQPADRAAVLVARAGGGTPVGMAAAQLVISTAEGAPSAWIEDVVVDRQYRNRGIARLLLRRLSVWAQDNGATRLQLLADRDNAPALEFYGRLGWKPTQLVAWRRQPGGR